MSTATAMFVSSRASFASGQCSSLRSAVRNKSGRPGVVGRGSAPLVVRAGPSPSVGSKVDGLGLPTDEPEAVESLDKLGKMQMAIHNNETSAEATNGTAMNFDGPAPERINGRLAMLGFTAALGAELAHHTPVYRQLSEAPSAIGITAAIIAAGTLISIRTVGRKALKFGPFNPRTELINGRAAMLGFAILLGAEGLNGGHSLF